MAISSSPFLFLIFFLTILFLSSRSQADPKPNPSRRQLLSVDYYAESCPQLDRLVASLTSQHFKDSPAVAPATIRLFFHDCFVEGCDGSILISTTGGSSKDELAEKDAEDNRDLAEEAFDIIKKAKTLVESKCPSGAVSCADILAIAARDFVHLTGGPHYQVKKGRRDGNISMASRVRPNLPRPNSTVDELLKLFSSKGLTMEDMVVLSGAHSIGFSHCKQFVSRLYYNHTVMDPRLLKALKMTCPKFGGNDDVVVPFDVTTPFSFDNAYYGNLEVKMGLLASDQALFLDPRTKPLVQLLAKDKKKFYQKFSLAMERMGSIGVKMERRHVKRTKDCTAVQNS